MYHFFQTCQARNFEARVARITSHTTKTVRMTSHFLLALSIGAASATTANASNGINSANNSSNTSKTEQKAEPLLEGGVSSSIANTAGADIYAGNKRVEDILKGLDQQQSRVNHLYQKQTAGNRQLAYNSALIKLKENSQQASATQGTSTNTSLLGKLNTLANNSIDKFRQTGLASWYGRQFQDKSSGAAEAIDMTSLTAAHSSLPMSCYIKVTNEENGQSVVVQVNGRVSDNASRIVDLSYAAAKKIGLTDSSKGKVSIERIASPE